MNKKKIITFAAFLSLLIIAGVLYFVSVRSGNSAKQGNSSNQNNSAAQGNYSNQNGSGDSSNRGNSDGQNSSSNQYDSEAIEQMLAEIAQNGAPLSDYKASSQDMQAQRQGKEEIPGLLSAVTANGYPLFLDLEEGIWYYSIVEGVYEYDPYVCFEFAGEEASVMIEDREISAVFTANNDSLEMLVFTDNAYSCYQIRVTTLPLISINIYEELGDYTGSGMDITVYDNDLFLDEELRLQNSLGTIKYRGGSSRIYPQKSYKVELLQAETDSDGNVTLEQNKLSLLNMRMDDDWILYSPYSDSEKIRNVFSTNLWYESCAQNNEYGITNGDEYRFVEVFVNGSYMGLYALGYPIDEKQLRIGKDTDMPEYLFKKKGWTDEYETDFINDNASSEYELKNDEENVETAWSELGCFYERMQALEAGGDITFDEVDNLVNIDTAVDNYLFFAAVMGVDNVNYGLKNLYVSLKWTGDGYEAFYTPWDLDLTWGDEFLMPYNISADRIFLMEKTGVNALVIANNEEMLSIIAERYAELRQGCWSDEHLTELIYSYEQDIYTSGAFLRQKERWPDAPYQEGDSLDNFREYVLEHMYYMDLYFE